MRSRGWWTCGAVLLLGLGLAPVVLAASEEDGKPASPDNSSPGWFDRILHPGSQSVDRKPPPVEKDAVKKPAADPPQGQPLAEGPGTRRARARAAFFRRVAVCDQLRQVALETNDPALEQRAEQLSQRAFELYNRSIAQIPAPPDATEPEGPEQDGNHERLLKAGKPDLDNTIDPAALPHAAPSGF